MKESNADKFLRILMRRMKHNKFDGVLLECNMMWLMENVYPNFAMFLKKLYEALKKDNRVLILTILPYSESMINQLTKNRFEYVTKYCDYVNIMTYDYFSYTKE
jgi:GH18 family chitinase